MIRIFISPTRSGSTALLRCFENNPAVERVYHQPVKSGFRQDGEFDYSFFEVDHLDPGLIHVAKETIGGFAKPETSFTPLPGDEGGLTLGRWKLSEQMIKSVAPLILMRDPVDTWLSIQALNEYSAGISPYYSPFEYFVDSYRNVFAFLIDAKQRVLPVHTVTLEMLGSNPELIMPRVCAAWGIPWCPAMIEWNLEYGVRTWFSDEAKARMEHDPRFRRSKEAMRGSSRFAYSRRPGRTLVPEHEAVIEAELMPIYRSIEEISEKEFGGSNR